MRFPLYAVVLCHIIAAQANGDESKNDGSGKDLTNTDGTNLPQVHIVVRTYSKAEVVQDNAQQQDSELGDSSNDLPIDSKHRGHVMNDRTSELESASSANQKSAKLNEPGNSGSSDKDTSNRATFLTQSFERISNMATLAWDYVTHTEEQTQRPDIRNDLSGAESFKEVRESLKTELLDDEQGANDVYFEEDNIKSTEEENRVAQHDHTFLNDKKSIDKVNSGAIVDDDIQLDSPVHKIKPKSDRNIRNEKVKDSKLKPLPPSHPRKKVKNSKIRNDQSQQTHSSGKNISSAYSQSDKIGNGTHDSRKGGSNQTIRVEENHEGQPLQADQPSYWGTFWGGSDPARDPTPEHPDTGLTDTEMDDDIGSASPVSGYDGDVPEHERSLVNTDQSYRPGLRYNSPKPVAEADLNTSHISRLTDYYDRCDNCMDNSANNSQRCDYYTGEADEFDKWAKYYTDILRYGCSRPDDQHRQRCCHGRLREAQTTMREVNKLVKSIYNVLYTQCEKCPVDCTWSEWQSWNHCPRTCDRPASKNRTRTRTQQRYGGRMCANEGFDTDIDDCPYEPGHWLDWSPWSACSSSCGGTTHRTRTCSQPTTYSCFVPCDYRVSTNYIDVQPCGNKTGCCEQGHWLSWSSWSECSSSCGGTTHRTRTCTQPTPNFCFFPCDDREETSYINVKPCNNTACCYDRQWSQWGDWTDCHTRDADTRTQRRSRWRSCEADPEYKDQPMCPRSCPGNESEVGHCCTHAMWGQWSPWSECLGIATVVDLETGKHCGKGCMNRTRVCIPGTCEGDTCYGDHIERIYCNLEPCCVPPIWSHWCPWSDCSETSGQITRRRTRVCQADPNRWRSPTCQAGGCYGQHDTSEVDDCCAPPNWSSWSQWSQCDFRGSSPRRTSTRHCIKNVEPACRHLECIGDRERQEFCECPPPNWGSWGQWSDCDFRGASPRRTRTRRCNKNLEPACQRLECIGERDQHETCVCPPPNWGSWGQWSECDFRGASPRRTMTRRCNKNLEPACQHLECIGERETRGPCECPQPTWSSWAPWSECDSNRPIPRRITSRYCLKNWHPACQHIDCDGDTEKEERCQCQPPSWGPWSQWGACNQHAVPPIRRRHRQCRHYNNPPYCQKDNCQGDALVSERCCGRQEWLPWQEWSSCDTRRNQPVRTRIRQCERPDSGCVDEPCIGDDRQTSFECPVPPCDLGVWSSWSSWSNCDCPSITRTSRRRSKHSSSGRPVCPPSSDTEQTSCGCPDCKEWCTGRADGDYPSCKRGCRNFVTCCAGQPLEEECTGIQQYDSLCQKCTKIPSPTCPDGQYDIYKESLAIPYKKKEECPD